MGAGNPTGPDRHAPDRYEPLPGFAGLPRWAWARLGRRLRIGVGVALLAALATAIPLAAGIRESKQERAESERREQAELRAERIRELQAEQRPRFGRSASVAPVGSGPPERLAARGRLMNDLSAAIASDSRQRVRLGALEGPIRRVECEPFPRTAEGVGAEEDLSRRRGRYYCVAVTAEFKQSEASVGGALGHPYRALVDFETGRYGYCKISGRPDPTFMRRVTTPRACGGR